MKEIGKLGVWFFPDALSGNAVSELARGVEHLAYDVLWYPEGTGYESFSFAGFALAETEKLKLASGIANIYARDAVTAIAGHDSLNSYYGDRFILGLGVSHVPLVEGFRGHNYGKPVATMRSYLDQVEAAELSIPVPERNIVLAALGPNMLALSRDRTKGAHPYLVTPEHTARARKILGPDKWLCVEQKVCLAEPAQARKVAASVLSIYMGWPNYRNNWLSLGFSEEDIDGRGSDRFLDAMVASGSADDIRAALQAHFDAGANHVCVQPLHPEGNGQIDWDVLEAVAGT